MSQSNQEECKPYPYAMFAKEITRKPYQYCPPTKPYTRLLKVSCLYQENKKHVFFIRLCGRWLEDAGFSINDKIKITIKDNLLIIEPVKE